MKTLLTKLFLTFGSVCLFGTGLHAQTYRLTAHVPFAFQAAGAEMSPGNYIIEQPSTSQVQRIENRVAKCGVFVAVAGTESNTGAPRLIFHRYGDRYFLAEIWNNQGTGTKLHASRAERALREVDRTAVASTVSVQLMASR